jgi:hypothetical protein
MLRALHLWPCLQHHTMPLTSKRNMRRRAIGRVPALHHWCRIPNDQRKEELLGAMNSVSLRQLANSPH